ncbi:hypothetical protein [Spiroplasma endosymbiont of Aspidapion aeneum]|uniref:hypothetical protein n=1 Tax=Spiroplasma endosymbiont of Aspidapion aeneum TaxID=3066276 RepID=UPI00313D02F3
MENNKLNMDDILKELDESKNDIIALEDKIKKYEKDLYDFKNFDLDKKGKKHAKKIIGNEAKFREKQKKMIEKYNKQLIQVTQNSAKMRKKIIDKIYNDKGDNIMKFVKLQNKLKRLSLDYDYKENELKRNISSLIELNGSL